MSKIETIGKVTLKLPSRINLERRRARARAELSTLDKAHKPPSPPLPQSGKGYSQVKKDP